MVILLGGRSHLVCRLKQSIHLGYILVMVRVEKAMHRHKQTDMHPVRLSHPMQLFLENQLSFMNKSTHIRTRNSWIQGPDYSIFLVPKNVRAQIKAAAN